MSFFFFNVKQWLEFCNYRSQVQLNLLHISNKNAQKCAFVCFFFLKEHYKYYFDTIAPNRLEFISVTCPILLTQ